MSGWISRGAFIRIGGSRGGVGCWVFGVGCWVEGNASSAMQDRAGSLLFVALIRGNPMRCSSVLLLCALICFAAPLFGQAAKSGGQKAGGQRSEERRVGKECRSR